MADQLDLLIARPPDASKLIYEGFSNLVPSYWKGLDEAYKRRKENLFQGGVPTLPDGSPDYNAIAAKTLQAEGAPGIPNYANVSNIDIARQQLRMGQDLSNKIGEVEGSPLAGGIPTVGPRPQGQPGAGGRVSAPGGGGPLPAPPPSNPAGTGTITRVGEDSIETLGARYGMPPEVIANVAQRAKLAPDAPLRDPAVVQRLDTVFRQFAQSRNGGGAPQAAQPPAPAGAPPPSPPASLSQRFDASAEVPDAAAPTMGNTVPNGTDPMSPQDRMRRGLYLQVSTNPGVNADAKKAAVEAIKAIDKKYQPTPAQSDYNYYVQQQRAMGRPALSMEAWRDKEQRDKESLQVLEKSVIPRVNTSMEKAAAARDDIDAIGRIKDVMNSDAGLITGIAANQRLALARAGSFFGFNQEQVANTQAFSAAMGQRVVSLIKAFGSGSAISEGDRKYAVQMAAGDITLDEKAIRKIMDIGEIAARLVIQRHNKLVSDVGSRSRAFKEQGDVFRVDEPVAAPARTAPATPAPPGQIKDGTVIVNPQTKERRIRQNGQWVPFT